MFNVFFFVTTLRVYVTGTKASQKYCTCHDDTSFIQVHSCSSSRFLSGMWISFITNEAEFFVLHANVCESDATEGYTLGGICSNLSPELEILILIKSFLLEQLDPV